MAAAVMIMDDTLILQAVAGVSEATSRCIVPILTQETGELAPQHWGAGFLVQAENHCFLISAAHVLDGPTRTCEIFCFLDTPPRYCWLRRRPLRLTEPPPGKKRRDDREASASRLAETSHHSQRGSNDHHSAPD